MPIRLFRIVMPVGGAARVAQDLEDREGPPQQRLAGRAPGLTITNCPGWARAAMSGACEGEHVVVVREARVRRRPRHRQSTGATRAAASVERHRPKASSRVRPAAERADCAEIGAVCAALPRMLDQRAASAASSARRSSPFSSSSSIVICRSTVDAGAALRTPGAVLRAASRRSASTRCWSRASWWGAARRRRGGSASACCRGRGRSWSRAAAALMWLNYAGYSVVLDDDSGRRLAAAAGATTLCALLLTVITVVHYSFGRRGSRVGTTLLVLTLAASLLFPLTPAAGASGGRSPARSLDLSGSEPAELEGPRVTIVAARRRLARLHRAGARPKGGCRTSAASSRAARRCTSRPSGRPSPAPVWTTVATGKYPSKTGVRAAAAYALRAPSASRSSCCPTSCFSHALVHLGILRESPYRSTGAARAAAVGDSRQPAAHVRRRRAGR